MRFTQSIRWRMQLWQGFLLLCILGGFGFTAFQFHRLNLLRQIDDELERRVAAVSADLRRPFGLPGEAPGGPGGPGGPRGFGGPNELGGPGGPGGPGRPDGPGPFRGFDPAHDGGPGPRRPDGEGRPRRAWMEDRFENREVRLTDRTLALFDTGDTNDFYFAIWSRSGALLKQSTNAPAGLACPARSDTGAGYRTRIADPFREIYQFTGIGECVLVGRSVARDVVELRRFAGWLVVAGAGVLALGLGGGWWVAGRALRPLDTISAAAGRISAGRLAERIKVEETDNELGRLAGILNATFARLEAAFAQQKQFTADASHELRTPIAVLIAETQTALTRERSPAEYRETVQACLDTAQQMRRLTQSLLELARFDAGQETFARSPFDLGGYAEAAVDLVRPLAAERQVSIHTALTPVEVVGDADRLGQVLINLLTNAIHYNRPGGEIRVTTAAEERWAVATVADTGVGISAEDLPHIFERFYRADKSRGRATGNSGLGLAIAKAIVDAHGGSLEVASQPGHGTTVTLRLPR